MQLVLTPACAAPGTGSAQEAILNHFLNNNLDVQSSDTHHSIHLSFAYPMLEEVKTLTLAEANELAAEGRLMDILISDTIGEFVPGLSTPAEEFISSASLCPQRSGGSFSYPPIIAMPSVPGAEITVTRPTAVPYFESGIGSDQHQDRTSRASVLAHNADGTVDLAFQAMVNSNFASTGEAPEVLPFTRVLQLVVPEHFRGFIGNRTIRPHEDFAGTSVSQGGYDVIGGRTSWVEESTLLDVFTDPKVATGDYYGNDSDKFATAGFPTSAKKEQDLQDAWRAMASTSFTAASDLPDQYVTRVFEPLSVSVQGAFAAGLAPDTSLYSVDILPGVWASNVAPYQECDTTSGRRSTRVESSASARKKMFHHGVLTVKYPDEEPIRFPFCPQRAPAGFLGNGALLNGWHWPARPGVRVTIPDNLVVTDSFKFDEIQVKTSENENPGTTHSVVYETVSTRLQTTEVMDTARLEAFIDTVNNDADLKFVSITGPQFSEPDYLDPDAGAWFEYERDALGRFPVLVYMDPVTRDSLLAVNNTFVQFMAYVNKSIPMHAETARASVNASLNGETS